ncbi:hypothetical protein DAPPUDRAFT_318946 [Daphnia pulex]|uniref:Uncharacterized protein n=1 Tax=Daphnia pulex TaxID=6669 RepID=E9GK77_DAPPU|nr:hypothetical protein DAPPUDRAFT_318946 [Daphnia pulex]|eukprot:EFX79941.1 hypothetical protein DAPPUDRAFT_318946 [Daphnia pulex]
MTTKYKCEKNILMGTFSNIMKYRCLVWYVMLTFTYMKSATNNCGFLETCLFYSTVDIDWVPSINLGSLRQDNQLLSLPTGCSLENGNETVQHERETQQDETSESTTFDLDIIEDSSVNVDIVEDTPYVSSINNLGTNEIAFPLSKTIQELLLLLLSQESTSSTKEIQPGTSSFSQLGINCQQSPCRDGGQQEIKQLRDVVEEICNKLNGAILEGSLLRDKKVYLEQKIKDEKLINDILAVACYQKLLIVNQKITFLRGTVLVSFNAFKAKSGRTRSCVPIQNRVK